MDALIKKRASIKGQLTSFTNYLNLVITKQELSKFEVIELKERVDIARALLNKFDDLQLEIEIIDTQDDLQVQRDQRLSFENKYYKAISQARMLIENNSKDKGIPSQDQTSLSNSQMSQSSNIESTNISQSVKLPAIPIPKFNGRSESWLEFRDLYQSLIHNDEAISNVNKFFYLRGALTGKAVDVIGSISFCAQNYITAWDCLCARYNSKRVLIHNHLKSLFNLPSMTRESSEKIRDINDAVSLHQQAISSLAPSGLLWDQLIIYLVMSKVDAKTARSWEEEKTGDELSTLDDMKLFLKNKAELLENIENKHAPIEYKTDFRNKRVELQPKQSRALLVNSNTSNCALCNVAHYINECPVFKELNISDRINKIKELKLCLNCFRKGHFVGNCRSGSCKTCQKRHNTMLHQTNANDAHTTLQSTIEEIVDEEVVTISALASHNNVFLATVAVLIEDAGGNSHIVRGVLDAGSQSSFISKRICKTLNLTLQSADVIVNGIGQSTAQTLQKCVIKLSSRCTRFKFETSCLVIENITGNLPNFVVNKSLIKISTNVKLADPNYDKPGQIDLLIGAEWFWEIINKEQIKLGAHLPLLQNTQLGWVITGPMALPTKNIIQCNISAIDSILNNQLTKFWELENGPTDKPLSVEESYCESHFIETHARNSAGLFIVTIPFKENPDKLGNSFEPAKRRLLSLERRLQSNETIKHRYISFMTEYESFGHMSLSNSDERESLNYLPHHGVLKEESVSTKLRVVFDASSESSSGYSYNSLQMIGPTIQQDLFSILLRFRKYAYAVTADIEKMCRQIRVTPSQRVYQTILWRSSPSENIKAYKLNTITYGTASAPYLAIRCLTQLGIECENSHPLISNIIKNDFYVDDVLTGSDSLEELQNNCGNLANTLKLGAFTLRKWVSNEPKVLNQVEHLNIHSKVIHEFTQGQTKTLGLVWSFNNDTFKYNISKMSNPKITMRTILSEVSQIFDPLGLLSPCVVPAKFLLQKLWLEKLGWDDPLPHALEKQWKELRLDLSSLNNLQINRHVICKQPKLLELHGFADASVQGYGACIYLRSLDKDNNYHVNLLCSRNRVAPLKPVTIPRLELCGAVVLAKLVFQAQRALNVTFHNIFLWTDSTIVLGWLKTPVNLLKPFVSHRIGEIHDLMPIAIWKHVPTDSNPADILSRGTSSSKLKEHTLWWHGPQWLLENHEGWPCLNNKLNHDLPELKREKLSLPVCEISTFPFAKFSKFNHLQRVVAYILRFNHNALKPQCERNHGVLSCFELQASLYCLVKVVQAESFVHELNLLKNKKSLNKHSKVFNLNPFLDEKGLIRVGGRLQHSELPYGAKHPILLPQKHIFTQLLIDREHLKLLHVGPQMLLASIRHRFWVISVRNIAKSVVRNCVKCFKASPKLVNPIMGNLPYERVTPAPPFSRVGVDYAGPIIIKSARGRGSKTYKSYICLFVCLSTKALHIELVGDLTTQSFILCLRRFASRKGKPSEIISDNGKNFVGAKSELKELANFLVKSSSQISERSANEGINWKFIPPYSPNFGGIWEAGVKSCKKLLKPIINNCLLTYEELNTLLVQIEGILNSRPLTPLSTNLNDLQPLCPSHFLIGRPTMSVADPDMTLLPENRLSKFQKIQQMQQQFWHRWSKEYLVELQRRAKWNLPTANIQVGHMVLIRDDNLPPLKWKIGRIEGIHPGDDGIIRVVTVRTADGIIKRATNRTCPLPSAVKCN